MTARGIPHSDRKGWQEVAAYDYRDRFGNLAFQSVRFYPKKFRQRRPSKLYSVGRSQELMSR